MAKEDILYDSEVHKQIKELVRDMLVLEIDYMPDEEIEEVVEEMKKLVRIKFYDKNVKINNDIKKIIKDKVMYDIDDNKYGIAGQTTVLIMDKIVGKVAKKAEKKLCVIVGIEKKEGCLKTTLKAIKSMFKSSNSSRCVLPKEDIERFRTMKRNVKIEQRTYVPYRMPMVNRKTNMSREIIH